MEIKFALIPIMIVVIIGNTASLKHIEIMSTFEPLENAIVLIVGGYLLPFLLLITSMIVFKNREHLRLKTK